MRPNKNLLRQAERSLAGGLTAQQRLQRRLEADAQLQAAEGAIQDVRLKSFTVFDIRRELKLMPPTRS